MSNGENDLHRAIFRSYPLACHAVQKEFAGVVKQRRIPYRFDAATWLYLGMIDMAPLTLPLASGSPKNVQVQVAPNQWVTGTIVGQDGGRYRVQYTYQGTSQQDIFSSGDVRGVT